MEEQYRLKAKRESLKNSRQENSPIPILSFSHLEVINVEPYVDETLLEGIEMGHYTFTDDLFFQCLSESADYLAYEPFRERIKEWQSIVQGIGSSESGRFGAQENLKKIGVILTPLPVKRDVGSKTICRYII